MQTGDLEHHAAENSHSFDKEPVVDKSEVAPQSPGTSSLSTRSGSLWQRLRDQRREVAAVVVLIVMAILWFDTGNSSPDSNSVSLDPLEGYEAIMSDFSTVDDGRSLRESADPFESPSPSIFDGGLSIPQSPAPAASSTVFAENLPPENHGTVPPGYAVNPDATRAFNTSAGGAARNSSEQQSGRRVRFAGRIQPTH